MYISAEQFLLLQISNKLNRVTTSQFKKVIFIAIINITDIQMSFVISLPNEYQQQFNTMEFLQMFPGSLPALTLQSGENEVPLENPLVTPNVLQLLQDVITTQSYPYIGDVKIQRALDYLGIDFPEFVYDPRYGDLLKMIPDLDWNRDYYPILKYAVDQNFLSLAQYLFSMISPEEHLKDDFKIVNYILGLPVDELKYIYGRYIPSTNEREEILLMLLQDRKVPVNPKSIYQSVSNHGYVNVLKYLNDVAPSQDYVVYLPYILRWIGSYPENFNRLAETIYYLGDLIPMYAGQPLMQQSTRVYTIFNDVYTGNLDDLKQQYLGNEYPFIFDLRDLSQALLLTALFTRHYDVFNYLMEQLETIENIGPFKGSQRAREAYVYSVNAFTDTYFNHPELITRENLKVVRPYIIPGKVPTYINQLYTKGYPKLARLL